MAKITYENKEFLNKNENIADKNKVNDTDLNEIKNVVNENDDSVGNLSNLNTINKDSLVGAINELLPIVLYETDKTFSAVADNTVISLNDNLSNYKRIVLYGISNNKNLGSVEVYNPTINDQPGMFIAANGSRSGMYAFNGTFRQWLITSENKITYMEATDISSKIVSSSALTGFVSDSTSIKIYKIIGFKN